MAQALNAEIVCVDSRQLYRFMDIGTAKPTPSQQQAVPHHLLDLLLPDQKSTAAQFLALAREVLRISSNAESDHSWSPGVACTCGRCYMVSCLHQRPMSHYGENCMPMPSGMARRPCTNGCSNSTQRRRANIIPTTGCVWCAP
jgi:hypothetical protein